MSPIDTAKWAAACVAGIVVLSFGVKSCYNSNQASKVDGLVRAVESTNESVAISAKTEEGVREDEASTRDQSEAAVRTVLQIVAASPVAGGGTGGGPGVRPVPSGDDGVIMHLAGEAYAAARRADCRLLGKGSGCEVGTAADRQR